MSFKVRVRREIITSLFLILSCSKPSEIERINYRVFVEVDTVKFGILKKTFKVWCYAKPTNVISIVSDVEGIINKVYIIPGQWIKKGDTMAKVYKGPIYKEIPIISPSSGRVEDVFISEGSPVNVGSIIGIISGGGNEVVLYIPLNYRKAVKGGTKFLLDNKEGKILYISNIPNDSILSYVAKGRVNTYIYPGAYLCDVIKEETDKVLYVKKSAIIGDSVIFKVSGNKVKSIRVKPIFEDDNGNVAVLSDLKVGSSVVVLGGEMLSDTMEVVY